MKLKMIFLTLAAIPLLSSNTEAKSRHKHYRPHSSFHVSFGRPSFGFSWGMPAPMMRPVYMQPVVYAPYVPCGPSFFFGF